MKIGIDISQIAYKGTGVGRFTNSLINALLEHDKSNKFYFYFFSLRKTFDSKLEKRILNKGHKLIKLPIPPSLLSIINNNIHSSFLSSIIYYLSSDLDYFLSSDWTEPALKTNKATVVHDIVFKQYSETLDKKIVSVQEQRLRWVRKESKIIFSDSQSTKDDLIKFFNIESEKIIVNYPGVDVHVPSQQQIQTTLKKYNLEKPFILSVGKQEPRKNIDRLVSAMKKNNHETINLVIVGPKGWGDKNVKSQISNVKYLGYISDNELYSLYSTCLFFVYPSLYEGFGYPIIEAMKLGAPVACSNTSSMKEIAGDSALLFDPLNTKEIFQCINTLMQDDKLRKELIVKGKRRSEIYSWEKYINILISNIKD